MLRKLSAKRSKTSRTLSKTEGSNEGGRERGGGGGREGGEALRPFCHNLSVIPIGSENGKTWPRWDRALQFSISLLIFLMFPKLNSNPLAEANAWEWEQLRVYFPCY